MPVHGADSPIGKLQSRDHRVFDFNIVQRRDRFRVDPLDIAHQQSSKSIMCALVHQCPPIEARSAPAQLA